MSAEKHEEKSKAVVIVLLKLREAVEESPKADANARDGNADEQSFSLLCVDEVELPLNLGDQKEQAGCKWHELENVD